MKNKIEQNLKPSLKHFPHPSLRIKIGCEFSLKEQEVINKLLEIEQTEEFQKLIEFGIIRRVKYFSDKLSIKTFYEYYEYKDNLYLLSADNLSLVEIREQNQDIIGLIKKIGEDNYKKFFLSLETYSFSQIAKELNISVDEVKNIFEFTNNIFIQNEFYLSQGIQYNRDNIVKRYTTVAKVNMLKDEVEVVYLAPSMFRGRYEISYDKLKGFLTNSQSLEIKKIKRVIKELEMLNLRNTTLHKVLESIIIFQKNFIKKEEYESLNIYTKNQLAKDINVCPSTICRLVRDKSIILPSGKEYPLEFFLPNRKKVIVYFLEDILSSTPKLKDKKLLELIKDKFNIVISRRTANYYKNLAKKNIE